MVSEKKVIKTIKNLGEFKLSESFVSDLKNKIAIKAEKQKNLSSIKNSRKKSFQFSWQLSLITSSLGIILIMSLVVFMSPSTREQISNQFKQEANSQVSDEVLVIIKSSENKDIFIYDLLQDSSSPLDLSVKKRKGRVEVSLYPGYYKVILVEENQENQEKTVVINNEVSEVVLNYDE